MKKDYVEVVYNNIDRPLTNYPNKLTKYLFDKYELKKEDKLLEIGCGRGEFLQGFVNLGIKGFGVDRSDNAKKICKNSEIKITDLEKEKIPYSDEYFDIVYSKSLIEHFYYPEKIFEEIFRVLKPGGKVITLTPDWKNTVKVFYEDYTHRTPFTMNSLNDIHLINGFDDVKIEKFRQLPILWEKNIYNKILLTLSYLTNTFLVPNNFRKYKWVKFSKEIMLLSFAKKNK
tara:strand:- start:400 stop:1086 length:687 start_codon:yes stop_codon:yes gene_type:complete